MALQNDRVEEAEEVEELDWAKINFPDLQDLLFQSDAESDSDDDKTPLSQQPCLEDKAKATPDQLTAGKKEAFPDGKLSATTKVDALRRLERLWSDITPQEFVITLYSLGPEAKQKEYLRSLFVEVDPALLPRKQQKHVHNITMLFAATPGTWSEEDHNRVPTFDAAQPCLRRNCGVIDKLGAMEANCPACGFRHRPIELVHRFAYTTVHQLFSSTEPRAQAYVLKALHDAGRSSLGTPMGRALLLDSWLRSRWEVFVDKLVDVLYLLVFVFASVKVRHGYVPGLVTIIALILLSVWTIFTKAVEVIAALKLFQSLYVLSTSLVLFAFELFNAITVLLLLWGLFDKAGQKCQEPHCYILHHLASLSLSIFFKWAHVISSMLCLRIFGERVLPAAYTIFSPESVRFLIVIAMLVYASFSAYSAYPIPGTVHSFKNIANASTLAFVEEFVKRFRFEHGRLVVPANIFKMLVKMFRLDMMGDFDIWELEGEDQVITYNASAFHEMLVGRTNSSSTPGAAIVDPMPNHQIHQGVTFLLMVLCLFINVIIMNLYIALLSSVYEGYSSQRWELLAEYKTIHVLRAKLSNPVNLLDYFDCTRRLFDAFYACWQRHGTSESQRAIWFAFRDNEFEAEGADAAPENSVVLAQIQGDVQQLVERVKAVQQHLVGKGAAH